jgi:hypothetical protein
MARLCISIPVHEQLIVVFDQIDNLRAFLPADTIIVLHVSQSFCDAQVVANMMPEGVYVNPTQLQTEWGDVMPQHHSNFRFIREIETFDYFVIHASNDMFVLPGAAEYIATADMGVQQHHLQPPVEHEPLRRMATDIGAGGIFHSQTEGTWYRSDLFAEMVEIIDKYWPANSDMKAPEEYFYPTIASTLDASMTLPYIHVETHFEYASHLVSPGLINAIRHRRFYQNIQNNVAYYAALKGEDLTASHEVDYQNVFAVKRIPREYWHAFRVQVRAITREQQPKRLRFPVRGTEPAAFQILTFSGEAIADETLLRGYRNVFSADDDVLLLVWVQESLAGDELPKLLEASTKAGLDDVDAPRVEAVVLPDTEESLAQVAWIADAVYSADLPLLTSDMLWARPQYASALFDYWKASTSAGVPS